MAPGRQGQQHTGRTARWPRLVWPISLFERPPLPQTIAILEEPWAFTQTRLLDTHSFIREARNRGVRLHRDQLELLHRRGLLVPFFRITKRKVATPRDMRPASQDVSAAWQLYLAAAEGRLVDPSTQPFRRWPRRDRGHILYSEYQLLAVRQLAAMQAAFEAERSNDNGITWNLARAPKHIRETMAKTRNLAMALEVLAPRYRPRIMNVIRSPSDEMYSHIDGRTAPSSWSSLVGDPELVLHQAERLLMNADTFDPLGKWSRVTRIGRPERWRDLRYDALVALEYRVAAEHLLMLREDLGETGEAPQLEPVSTTWREARHGRLSVDARERAETLLDFRLTDVPAVVLALEGATEMTIAPRVLSLMGFDERQGEIQLINLKSVDGDVRLLARAVAVPRIDPEGYRGARVLRPLTGLVIAVDQEKKYSTAEKCEAVRQGAIDEILDSMPKSVRTSQMRADLEYLVKVRTWGTDGPFEFAHFTDRELARGLKQVGGRSAPSLEALTEIVARHRSGDKNVESIWKKWRPKPTKPALADALWPALERRMLRKTAANVPIADAVAEAVRLAQEVSVVRELRTSDAD